MSRDDDPTNTEMVTTQATLREKVGIMLFERHDYAGASAEFTACEAVWSQLTARDATNTLWSRGRSMIANKLGDVKLALIGDSESPIATLIKSGALDLSKPGNLVKFLPKRPPAIVEAEDDRIVLDLMKVPAIANNAPLRRLIAVLTPVVNIRAIETDRDHIYVALKASPGGLPRAITALRNGV